MEGIFDVTRDGQAVGTVQVKKEGLYYRISCRCRVADTEIHRLYAGREKIGVLIPERGELTLETRVAAKRLRKDCVFSLDESMGVFVPIHLGETFDCLDKLRSGRLGFREGVPGLDI